MQCRQSAKNCIAKINQEEKKTTKKQTLGRANRVWSDTVKAFVSRLLWSIERSEIALAQLQRSWQPHDMTKDKR